MAGGGPRAGLPEVDRNQRYPDHGGDRQENEYHREQTALRPVEIAELAFGWRQRGDRIEPPTFLDAAADLARPMLKPPGVAKTSR
jgi:hypothetical protein